MGAVLLAAGMGWTERAAAQATTVYSDLSCAVFLDLPAPAGSSTPFLPFTVPLCGGEILTVTTRNFPLRPAPDTDLPFYTGTFSYSLSSPNFREPINPAINPGDYNGRFQNRASVGWDLLLDFDLPISAFGMSTLQSNGAPVLDVDRMRLFDGPLGTGNLIADVTSQGPPPTQYFKAIRFTGYDAGSPVIRSVVINVQSDPYGLLLDGLAFGAAAATASVDPRAVSALRRLEGPFPSPAVASASFRVQVADDAPARLEVLDLNGRRVRTLLDAAGTAGWRVVTWDGRDDSGERLPNGVYFARLTSVGHSETRRVHLVR